MDQNIKTTDKFIRAYRKIQAAENILLLTHERPDGDALASLCALADLAESLNKKYTAFCADQPSENFFFLPRVEKIISAKSEIKPLDFDLIMVLDCGSLSRTGLKTEINQAFIYNQETKQKPFIIEFDHHPKTDDYADLEIRFPEAAATAEILYYFFKANNIRLTKNIANCLLTGILTDTANFLYPSASGQTASIAAEMLLDGARFPKIMEKTIYNKSLSAMKLWGATLDNLEINEKYGLAFSVLSREEIKRYDDNEDVWDTIANFLGNLRGVKGVMLLREEINAAGGKQLKGSLRSSHPRADISRLAAVLGGGGHPKAAGFVVKGELQKTASGWEVV